VIELRGITREFEVGGRPVHALRGIDLTIEPGEHVSIMGPSGSGKSTLLNIIGCLDRPTSGSYRLDGREVAGLDDRALSRVRGRQIGFVFQAYHLVPRMTAAQNVELPMVFAGVERAERRRRARQALDAVGLVARAEHRPNELSGGERQRLAIARALAMEPKVLLADEPTGNLDSRSGGVVLDLLDRLHAGGLTVLVVTHDPHVARRADRTVILSDGAIVRRATREELPAALLDWGLGGENPR
jgi:putative ABC transport system ATP-binding protein